MTRRTLWWMTRPLGSLRCALGLAGVCEEGLCGEDATFLCAPTAPTNSAAAKRRRVLSRTDANMRKLSGFRASVSADCDSTPRQPMEYIARGRDELLFPIRLYSILTERLDSATDVPCLAVTRTSHCPGPGVRCTSMGMEPSGSGCEIFSGLRAISLPSRNSFNVTFVSSPTVVFGG